MKVFIATETFSRVAEEREEPFLMGSNYVSKVRVYFDKAPDNWYPTMKFIKANGRKRGPITYDALDEDEQELGCGVETIKAFNNYKTQIWYYFDFTLSAWEGLIDTSGELQMTIIINCLEDSVIAKQYLINTKNFVHKTTVYGDEGNVIVIGDDP